jgi:hypothetical protein
MPRKKRMRLAPAIEEEFMKMSGYEHHATA